MTQNAKMQKMQMSIFVQNRKKTRNKIYIFCVITFEPIKIKHLKKNCLNLSFVKDEYTVGEKVARKGKIMKYIIVI